MEKVLTKTELTSWTKGKQLIDRDCTKKNILDRNLSSPILQQLCEISMKVLILAKQIHLYQLYTSLKKVNLSNNAWIGGWKERSFFVK